MATRAGGARPVAEQADAFLHPCALGVAVYPHGGMAIGPVCGGAHGWVWPWCDMGAWTYIQ